MSRLFDSRSSYIGTWSGCGAVACNIGQADVVLQDVIRAREGRPKCNIRAQLVRGGERLDDLGSWIAHDDVATDEIVTGCVKELDAVRISADIAVFNPIPTSGTLKADAESHVSVDGVDAAVAIERAFADHVLIAGRKANPSAPGSVRSSGVVHPHVVFNDALRGERHLHATPAIAIDRDFPHGDSLAGQEKDPPAVKPLNNARSLDRHMAPALRFDSHTEVGVGREAAACGGSHGSGDRVSVEAQLDVVRAEGDTRIRSGHDQRNRADYIIHQFAVIEDRERGCNGAADLGRTDRSHTDRKHDET